ncbi:MAG TPA: phospholipase D family protein [Myxococcales bacterium]|jgi:phosphatidylserine/phosphatidylglycerophosphate/cardiolipin synthase-like enzyme
MGTAIKGVLNELKSTFPKAQLFGLGDLDSARKSVTYETYNLLPHDPISGQIVDRLIAARARGVDVHVVLDAFGAPECRRFRAGVDIYVYPDRVHTKALSVDGRFATIGSSNLDEVSLAHDREIVSLIEDAGSLAGLDRTLFDRDVVGDPWGRKTAHLPRKLAGEPFWGRVQDAIVRGVRPESFQ